MIKLLNSNFTRLRMNQIFRIGIIVSAVLGVVTPTISEYITNTIVKITDSMVGRYTEEGLSLDYFLYKWVFLIVVYFALYCSCFIGTEYNDGTIRNKIAAGYSRSEIYLANFVANVAGGCILFTVYVIADRCVGRLYRGKLQIFTSSEAAIYTLCIYALIIAFAGILTFISMLISNEALAVILCIGTVVALMLIPILLLSGLQYGEYFDYDAYINGVIYEEGSLCPYYVGGIRRSLYIFLVKFLPGGPLMDFWAFEGLETFYLNPSVSLMGSTIFAAVPTIAGIALFKRKELK